MTDPALATNPVAARNFAMQLLARRDHCIAELALKLIRQGFNRELAAHTVATLEAENLVNDQRYIENFISYQVEQGFGPIRIGHKLKAPSLELDPAVIDRALGDDRAWVKRAGVVREKKFGTALPGNLRDKVKQAYFLQHRGFTAAQIRLLMGTDIEIDDWK